MSRSKRLAHVLFGWLPRDARESTLRHLLIVWAVAPLIALANWGGGVGSGVFHHALVYSYAISTAIWFLSDPLRIALRGPLRLEAPNYWQFSARVLLYMTACSLVGFAVGSRIGDAWAGHSTWATAEHSLMRVLGIAIVSVLASALFVMYFYLRGKSESLQRHASEARLKLLETQLEPHMLFNTLANLRALIATDPPAAIRMLDRLNDYLRATLRASRADPAGHEHTLADEFARLTDYLELMAVRMGPRLRYAFEASDDLLRHRIAPLLLQPLVENAIRHGLEPSVDGGAILVRAVREGSDRLLIEVSDTGVGMAQGAVRESGQETGQEAGRAGARRGTGEAAAREDGAANGGFGIAQVRERIDSLTDGRGACEIVSREGGGTCVRLHLPLIDTEDTR
ncbi:MAG: sensor histidine kinase [Lautropia sp.]